jgi:hypothetical protein
MRSLRRMGITAVFASALAMTVVVVTPASASDGSATTATVTIEEACAKLSEAITFLEGRPQGRLRDFLLAQARRLFATYCQTV